MNTSFKFNPLLNTRTIVVEKMRITVINYAAKPHQSVGTLDFSDLSVVPRTLYAFQKQHARLWGI